MHLDETILQSNTCIELIRYIKKLYKVNTWEPRCERDEDYSDKLDEEYFYIMKTARKALKRRSSGFQVADIFKEDEGDESYDSDR